MKVDPSPIDEILEAIWVAREENRDTIADITRVCGHQYHGKEVNVEETLPQMQTLNLVLLNGGAVELQSEGEKRAMGIIRRHRLAERLFTDVLQVSEKGMEMTACYFEHILDSEVMDSVCAFLGHPPLCPHGKPIPAGECCGAYERNWVKPLVVCLADLELGKEGEIVFITPSFHKRFDRLTALGVIAGNRVKVHQKKPSFVVRMGETEVAIDKTIAQEIFVKAT
ncbi:MAG: metal-dependent transcriptional regulator [Candidatus Neomarinimicrobiota bacterium]